MEANLVPSVLWTVLLLFDLSDLCKKGQEKPGGNDIRFLWLDDTHWLLLVSFSFPLFVLPPAVELQQSQWKTRDADLLCAYSIFCSSQRVSIIQKKKAKGWALTLCLIFSSQPTLEPSAPLSNPEKVQLKSLFLGLIFNTCYGPQSQNWHAEDVSACVWRQFYYLLASSFVFEMNIYKALWYNSQCDKNM